MYEEHLTSRSIFFSRQTLCLIVLFFLIRIISYYLTGQTIIQAIIIFCLIMLLGILYFKNPDWALYLVLIEIFLGGTGHFLEFLNLPVRTALVGFYFVLWGVDQIGREILWKKLRLQRKLNKLLLLFFLSLLLATIIGLVNNHPLKDVIQSIAPYLFLILLFPAHNVFANDKTQEYLARLMIVFIICTAIFSLLIFVIYSSQLFVIQDSLYNWYHHVANGEIINLGNGFFRIIEPGHLLIVPFILIMISLLMRDEHHHKMWRLIMFCAILILILNFSRTYFLALALGFLILKYKHKFHRWFIVSATTVGLSVLIFISISLLASTGKTFGFEQFGIKFYNPTQPQIELTSATRLMVLPVILDVIKANPILGTGLGSTITFFNTLVYDQVVTSQFEWGYLQMWIELGLFGLLSFFSIIFFTIASLIKKIRAEADWQEFDVGLLSGLIAFLAMNTTTPVLFSIFGIIYLIFVLTIALKNEANLFERLIKVLYQVFNKIETSK